MKLSQAASRFSANLCFLVPFCWLCSYTRGYCSFMAFTFITEYIGDDKNPLRLYSIRSLFFPSRHDRRRRRWSANRRPTAYMERDMAKGANFVASYSSDESFFFLSLFPSFFLIIYYYVAQFASSVGLVTIRRPVASFVAFMTSGRHVLKSFLIKCYYYYYLLLFFSFVHFISPRIWGRYGPMAAHCNHISVLRSLRCRFICKFYALNLDSNHLILLLYYFCFSFLLSIERQNISKVHSILKYQA